MARKPEPIPAFFDHYNDFTRSLENYTAKAGLLLVAAESFLTIAEDAGVNIPGGLADRLKRAIAEYKEAANGQ